VGHVSLKRLFASPVTRLVTREERQAVTFGGNTPPGVFWLASVVCKVFAFNDLGN
jgi:hypothetical protein